jgi:hypothetical protein
MFAFNPGNEDQSGRILGGAYANAAQTTADANVKLVDDIGSSLVSLAAAYGSKKGTEAKGKNFKKFMGMAGDTFGMDSAMFGDMEDYDAGMMLENFAPMMPAMANAQLGQQRMGVQQQGQQMNSPGARAAAANAATVAQRGSMIPGARYQRNPNP